MESIDQMILILSPFNKIIKYDVDKEMTTIMLVMLFVCQSVFFTSYSHLHQKMMRTMEHVKTEDRDKDSKNKDPRMHCVLLDDSLSHNVINLEISNSRFDFGIVSTYRIADININDDNADIHGKNITKIKSIMTISSNDSKTLDDTVIINFRTFDTNFDYLLSKKN